MFKKNAVCRAVVWGSLASLGLLGAASAAETASDALQAIEKAGYVATYDLEKRYNYWVAETTNANGERVEIILDGSNQISVVSHAAAATGQIASAAQVVQFLSSLGYRDIDDVELDDGFWTADARNLANYEVELVLHPVTLELLQEVYDVNGALVIDSPASTGNYLSAAQVKSILEAAGYTNVRDLELDDGFWEADARNAAGFEVDLVIDPVTGAVLREKRDS